MCIESACDMQIMAVQGLSEETNVALDATMRALDLDVKRSVQGLPMEELVAAGLLSKFLLCSNQGLLKACHPLWPKITCTRKRMRQSMHVQTHIHT